MKSLKPYLVTQCPRCGWVQTGMGRAAMKCRRCGRTSKYFVGGRPHVKMWEFDKMSEAIHFCQTIRGKAEIKHDRRL